MQGAWHESASKLEQRRSNGLGAQVSGLKVHHLLADKILAEYSTSGTFSSTDLNSPGASIVVSDRLTFLGKYREFYKLVEESEFGEAATLLHSLLWSKLAPKYFLVTLLIHHLQASRQVPPGQVPPGQVPGPGTCPGGTCPPWHLSGGNLSALALVRGELVRLGNMGGTCPPWHLSALALRGGTCPPRH